MTVIESGPVAGLEQILKIADDSPDGQLLYIAKEAEFITFWARVDKGKDRVLYFGTEDTFNQWLAAEVSPI